MLKSGTTGSTAVDGTHRIRFDHWPSADGFGAARIDEEVVVTAVGARVITEFPPGDVSVADKRYFTVGGDLRTRRDSRFHLNTPWGAPA